ncbi:hypothetical protein D0U02_00370 [Burkholderia pseudomallei]|uniref:Uncharacterized protein n=1 Tax=Burkholderia pseudomallei (strain K96243) TaxID=272560 RepID=Q63XG2_BURPS|nr:hypothetical protein D0U05_02330 [Burkholderia pseudomallei]RFS67804.1 hypothetical protein D0U02_00370 [Burkholderia pseudomallei]RFS72223.1 hypothetical protein D0U01_01100 [Burkholderia pseudomallei]RFS76014.1 hypothetical protein D0T98_00370 [Burkholderia pseudomallei]CAH34567.1 hypothetical protein BPSL0575 [Burkholderia pseudomallei K96243]
MALAALQHVATVRPVASVVRIDPRTDSCIVARRSLIELYKTSQPFGEINWLSSCWDITDALRDKIKGYTARKRALVHFTRHREVGQRIGLPFPEEDDLASVIKAFACRQHVLNGVTAARHMVYIRAWRYIVGAMRGTDIAQVTPATFNSAALAATREKSSSAYTVHGALEAIADMLDELRLTKVPLRWRWVKKKRGKGYGGSKQIRLGQAPDTDRRASDDVVYAVAQLYRIVPKTKWADRICVLLATILVCTGLRLGQVLCLRAEMPAFDEATGEHFIRLVAFKRTDATRKTLLSETVGLLNDVFRELLEITEPVREVARWLDKNPGRVNLPKPDNSDGTVTAARLRTWFGLSTGAFKRRLQTWGFAGAAIPLHELNERLLRDRFDKPVVPGTRGEQLLLKDCLSISFVSAMKQTTAALKHAVRPIGEQHVSDRLRGRQLGDGRSRATIFDRYSLTDSQGNPLSTYTHGFRHKLNDALDKGGAPDVIQAQWFGRANPRDNKAYQYRTHAEMRERARDMLIKGQLNGRFATLLSQVTPECRKEAAESMVQVAHPISGGYCLQNFAQVDCEHCGQCLDECMSFHWVPGETDRQDEVIAIRDTISRKLNVMLDKMSPTERQNDESFSRLRHQQNFVNQILKSMEESKVGEPNKT